MTKVVKAEISVTKRRIGTLILNHEGLMISCEICVYKDEKLWIRMPEIWTDKETKCRLAYWESKEICDQNQDMVLKKVFDMLGLDLEKAIQLRKNFFATRKELTKQENKLTLNKKNPEV